MRECAVARKEYGWEYRLVSGTSSILHSAAATIPCSCRLFQVVAFRRKRSGKTFNPKVVGSIPTRPIKNRLQRPHRGCQRACPTRPHASTHCLLVPQAAVGEPDRSDAVGLLEVELDQRPPCVPVPDPGERQAGRRLDLGVLAAAAVFDGFVWVAHDHPHDTAYAQVDLGGGGLPVVLGVPPAPNHLLAGPRVENRLGGRPEGALHSQRLVVDHVPGSRRRRRRTASARREPAAIRRPRR